MQNALTAYSRGPAAPFVELRLPRRDGSAQALHPFLASSSAEKRKLPRRRVLLSALIVSADFSTVYRCRVRDVSEAGAKLDIPAGYPPAAAFWLVALSSGLAYEAKLVWRRYPNVGVQLSEPLDLAETNSRVGQRLRSIWASLVS